MDANTAAQKLGVAAYTVRSVELDADRNVWLVTVRDMCTHTNSVRELPREKATGGVVTGTAYLVGETGPEETAPLTADADGEVVPAPAAKPKTPRKSKAKP